jgi:cytidylate kinase
MTFIKQLKRDEENFEKDYPKQEGLTITVSGLASSGKSVGAKALAKHFKLEYVSAGDIVRQLAKERNISLHEICHNVTKDVDLEIDKITIKHAIKGKVVLDGRLTGWAAGEHATVRIIYITPFDVRVKRFAERENVNIEEARNFVEKRDNKDIQRYKNHYGIDIRDSSIYHIQIDNSGWTLEDAKTKPIELVEEFLKK